MRYLIPLLYIMNSFSNETINRKMDQEYQSLGKFLAQKIKERDAFENELEKPLGVSEEDQFLNAIQGVESSFGNNVNHRVLENGIHKGDRAVGSYALMPNTIKELSNKVRNPETNLGKQLPYKSDFSDLHSLSKLSNEEMIETLGNDPGLENKLARLLAKDIMTRSKGTQDAAYRWNMGQNIPKGSITQEQLDNSNYVQKFDRIRKMLGGVALAE